jgi:DNA polymerase I
VIDLPFREIWACDFEYRAPTGERPQPVCMCARDLRSGREIRLWGNDLRRRAAPFDTGPDSVLVAYAAAAELSCFLALGWPLPANVIDLFAEHRVATNGIPLPCGNGLLGALAIRGLAHINTGEKEEMRRLILGQTDYSDTERAAILAYCMSDIDALAALLPTLPIELPFALLRGRYGAAVACMERAGIPIDVELYRRVVENWGTLKRDLIDEVNAAFGVYDEGHFRLARFVKWLMNHRVANWPHTETGLLATDDDTFDEQIALHPELPELRLLRELRATLHRMKLIGLAIGADGRNRTGLKPFQAITGRNLPSASEFIFGPARWMRGFIKPPKDFGLASFDFKAEEVAIAAALSGDARLAEHYSTGDVYWRFAVITGLGAPDASGLTRKMIRDLVKVLFLGIGYGMQAPSLARQSGKTLPDAKELLQLHATTYPDFTRWREAIVDRARLNGWLCTGFGWRRRGCENAPATELMNWPIQSAGADLMRLVCIAATEAGIEVAAPVHDGFLIVAPLARLRGEIDRMKAIMGRASEIVTGGLTIHVEVETVTFPDRYMDERGRAMWDRVIGLLERKTGETEKTPKSPLRKNLRAPTPGKNPQGQEHGEKARQNAPGQGRGEVLLKITDCLGSPRKLSRGTGSLPGERSLLIVYFLWEILLVYKT